MSEGHHKLGRRKARPRQPTAGPPPYSAAPRIVVTGIRLLSFTNVQYGIPLAGGREWSECEETALSEPEVTSGGQQPPSSSELLNKKTQENIQQPRKNGEAAMALCGWRTTSAGRPANPACESTRPAILRCHCGKRYRGRSRPARLRDQPRKLRKQRHKCIRFSYLTLQSRQFSAALQTLASRRNPVQISAPSGFQFARG